MRCMHAGRMLLSIFPSADPPFASYLFYYLHSLKYKEDTTRYGLECRRLRGCCKIATSPRFLAAAARSCCREQPAFRSLSRSLFFFSCPDDASAVCCCCQHTICRLVHSHTVNEKRLAESKRHIPLSGAAAVPPPSPRRHHLQAGCLHSSSLSV